VHGANGYLLDEFLTGGVNMRTDVYDGSATARVRLMAETVTAVRAAVKPGFLVGVRVSQTKVNDHTHRWRGRKDGAQTIFQFGGERGGLHSYAEHAAWRPACEGGALSLAALAKKYGGLPVIANGALHDPIRAAAMLDAGEADTIALARGAPANVDWPDRVRYGRPVQEFEGNTVLPVADLATADAHRKTHAHLQVM
jgi:2,4-dienoyl-CoA reductase-like NADH-dependent reductase (Old Yellow Enzyme family)